MDEPAPYGSSVELANLIEANSVDFLLAMGRAGGGEERDDLRVQWIIGGSPVGYHNAVVRANLRPEEADEVIAASVERFRSLGVPGSWHVGPSMRPRDLAQRLTRAGFGDAGAEPGMAIDLASVPEDLIAPAGLVVRRITDDEELDAWAHTLSLGFGEGELEANWVRDTYRRIGLGDDVPWRHYLARLDDRPVATASTFFAAGVAGIYFVSTAPAFRRRGFGAAITLAASLDARNNGYRVAVLGASDMGRAVYERIGFREHCRIDVFELSSPRGQ
jgi:ribosomal protein S18 acetylase RimI-like enzyme